MHAFGRAAVPPSARRAARSPVPSPSRPMAPAWRAVRRETVGCEKAACDMGRLLTGIWYPTHPAGATGLVWSAAFQRRTPYRSPQPTGPHQRQQPEHVLAVAVAQEPQAVAVAVLRLAD